MKRKQAVISVLCLAICSLCISYFALGRAPSRREAPRPHATASTDPAGVRAAYGRLPLTFEANSGQTDPRVKFLARGAGYALFLTDRGATLHLTAQSRLPTWPASPHSPGKISPEPPSVVVRLDFAGSSTSTQVQGLDLQPGRSNYLVGNNPALWHRDVPHYTRVKYPAIYPGIDLIYYGNHGQLESDYLLAPGADPSQIALRIEGADRLQFDNNSGLTLSTSAGDLTLHRPVAYQETAGHRQEIAASYIQRGPGIVGFQLGPYDRGEPLIIDPVVGYATYLGGSLDDLATAIAVDSSGNAYLTGHTSSTDFPTTAGVVGTKLNCTRAGDAFVAKLNPAGTALVYSTYLGGSCGNLVSTLGGEDIGFGIAVDASGDAYVTGQTGSSDFPTTPNAFQLTNGGGAIFVSKLDPAGQNLLYSTYIHGNGGEYARAIAVDANGNAYVTGVTSSTTFPAKAPGGTPFQTTANAVDTAFVCRIDPTQTGVGSLVYSTYLGGSSGEFGFGIAVDANANVYVTGSTTSTDFPLMNAFQTKLGGASGAKAGNAFITRLDLTQLGSNALIYSTYLGGSGTTNAPEQGSGIAIDANHNAYVTGATSSSDFPVTPGALQTVRKNTLFESFVARFDTTKSGISSLVYSTYLGGSTNDFANAIAVDSLGDAFVTGETASADFPVTPGAPQLVRKGVNAFISELNPTGTGLLFSTFFGGSSVETGEGIALDTVSPPSVYVSGFTGSADFPATSGALQTALKGSSDAFVAKLSPGAVTGVFASPASLSFGNQNVSTPSPSQAVTLTNASKAALTINSITVTGANAADFSKTSTCAGSLAAGANCAINIIFTPSTTGSESATLTITDSDASSPQLVQLSGTGTSTNPDFSISISPSSVAAAAGSSASFSVSVTALNGFSAATSLACTGAPKDSTCTLTPTSVTPTGTTPVTSNGVIQTTMRTMVLPLRTSPLGPSRPFIILTTLSVALALCAAWLFALRRGSRKLAWGLAMLAALTLSSCSGLPHRGTPAGAFTITVTGTSGSLTHSATVTLNVS